VDRVRGREVGSGGVDVAEFRKVKHERGPLPPCSRLIVSGWGEGGLRQHFISNFPRSLNPPPQAYPAAAAEDTLNPANPGHLGHARGTALPSCLPTLVQYGGGG